MKLNEQKTLALTGIFTVLFCCFGLIPGLPVFMVTAAITPKFSQAILITLFVILLPSIYFTFNINKLGKMLCCCEKASSN